MKILIVTRFFYPENSPRAFRATELAKEFARQGHELTVLTKYRSNSIYEALRFRDKIKINSYGRLKCKDIQSKNLGKIIGLFTRGLRRLMLIIFHYPHIENMFRVKKALRKENNYYDLLISIAVPHPIHWGTCFAMRRQKIVKTWIADCGDPFMGVKYDKWPKPFYFKYLEKCFSRWADYITIPKIEMKDNYYKEFQYKIHEIPQGFDLHNVNLYKGKMQNTKPTFCFAGYFIKDIRDPRPFLDCLATLEKDFLFIIYTKNRSLVKKYENILQHKLEIRDYIPRDQLLFELSKMDFLVNISYDPKTQAPSKLIDYSISGRPILMIKNTNVNKKIVNQFLNGDYRNSFKINISKHDIKKVSQQFLDLHNEKEIKYFENR